MICPLMFHAGRSHRPAAGTNRPTKPPPARSSSPIVSFCVWMGDSTTTVDPSGASSRTSVDWYWPAPRKDNGTWIVLASGTAHRRQEPRAALPAREQHELSDFRSGQHAGLVPRRRNALDDVDGRAGKDALGIGRDGQQRAGEHGEACNLVRHARVAPALGEEHRRVVGGPGEVPCESDHGVTRGDHAGRIHLSQARAADAIG